MKFSASILLVWSLVALVPSVVTGAPGQTTSTVAADSDSSLPVTVIPAARTKATFQSRHAENLQRIKDSSTELVFLGDSITQGWASAADIWKENFGRWSPVNLGVGGDRTQNVLWRLNNGEFEGISPKVVVLMIGTNNTHSDEPADIVLGIRKIIDTIHEKSPETKVLLLAVFPREPRMRDGKLQTMPLEKVREINRLLPALADNDKVRFLDIGEHFLVDGKVPKEIMPDGVHLSKKGYAIWAKQVTPVLKEMME